MKNKLLIFPLIIIVFLAIGVVANQFFLFPSFPFSKSSAGDCISMPDFSLSNLVNKSEIILTGTATGHKWVAQKSGIETQTKIAVDNVIKGTLSSDEIIVMWNAGSSLSEVFIKGDKYLLFLAEPNDDGIYSGLSTCDRRKYTITLDDSGNEIVPYFASDIENGIEKEIECPGGPAPTGIVEDITGKKTEIKPAPCVRKYVLMEDLIKQIK